MIGTMPSGNSILVTGANSGLGKYIADSIDCVALTRANAESVFRKHKHFDLIIHCAFNASKKTNNYYKVLQDNIFLTKRLCSLSHDKFIFLSSIDVYREEYENSTFNYVLQSDILSMIQVSAKNSYSGIIDFVASSNIRLKDIANHFSKTVNFGDYFYETPIISNRNLQEKFPTAWYTSLGNIERFIKEPKG